MHTPSTQDHFRDPSEIDLDALDLLTVAEVAALLGKSPTHVRTLLRGSILGYYQFNKLCRRVPRAEVVAYRAALDRTKAPGNPTTTMSLSEAAHLLKVGMTTANSLMSSGALHADSHGRISHQELTRYLADAYVPAAR